MRTESERLNVRHNVVDSGMIYGPYRLSRPHGLELGLRVEIAPRCSLSWTYPRGYIFSQGPLLMDSEPRLSAERGQAPDVAVHGGNSRWLAYVLEG